MIKASTAVRNKFVKNKDYLVCIDSDGCAFDVMWIEKAGQL